MSYHVAPSNRQSPNTSVDWSCWKSFRRPFTGHVNYWLIRSNYFFCQSVSSYSCTSDPSTYKPPSSRASSAVSSADSGYAAAPAKETSHNVLVAKPVTLVPCPHTPVMVPSICSFPPIIEPKSLPASRASLQTARWIIEVAPRQPFYVLLENFSEKQAFIPKHMIIAQTLVIS